MNIYSSHDNTLCMFMHLCCDAVTVTPHRFRQKDLNEQLIREVAITKSRCQVHKRFLHSSSPHHPLNGASPVETQNFASHEEVFARRGSDNVLTVGAFVARETQDFASLLWWTAILYSGNWDGTLVA